MKYSTILLLLAAIFTVHMLTFACVFLNIFNHMNAFSSHAPLEKPATQQSIPFPIRNAVVKRLVFFILDAFRTGFIFSHKHCLPGILNQAGLVLNVRTFTPTVTSPRLKTLTTGTVPEFADFFFNMQSSEIHGDSLLKRWNDSNMSIAFYGDDTWLKLFPSQLFLRHKEVSSFYAVDFTEVDNAVTEPLLNFELKQSDWNVLILHYLGLDHIGHSRGPDGELVCRKLLEMDAVFNNIFEQIIAMDNSSMLVVLGDHGMSNEGSHGGSTDDELYTPVLFVSQLFSAPFRLHDKASLTEISQVDIATSLALLTQVTIPSSSLGVIPRKLFETLPVELRRSVLRSNYEHLLNLCSDCGPYAQFDEDNLSNNYKEMLRLQQILLGRHSTVNRVHLSALVAMLVLSTGVVVFSTAAKPQQQPPPFLSSYTLLSFIFVGIANALFLFSASDNSSLIYSSLFVIWPLFLPINLMFTLKRDLSHIVVYIPLLAFNAFVLFSSSFIEEEHFFWYLATPLLIFSHAYLYFRQYFLEGRMQNLVEIVPFFILAVCVRLCKAYIYPGVKWADDGLDYARHFRADSSFQTPLFLVFSTFSFFVLLFWQSIIVPFRWRIFVSLAFLLNFTLIFSYKAVRGDLRWSFWLDYQDNVSANDAFTATPFAQASFVTFALTIICLFVKLDRKTAVRLALPFIFQLGCLLLRCYLVVPLFLLLLIANSLNCILSDQLSSNVLIISVSRMAFFALENSNRLATVDVGAAYTGLSTHDDLLSGCLIYLATSFGPLFMFFSVSAQSKQRGPGFMAYQCAIFVLCACCVTLQANHLFVWSVFAPKLLYEVFWTTLIFLASIVFRL